MPSGTDDLTYVLEPVSSKDVCECSTNRDIATVICVSSYFPKHPTDMPSTVKKINKKDIRILGKITRK